ncbi:MAG: glycosyltransferase family 39 protein [Deltaproteobacteria bacterium]|nr:glycosyltransferase family 39 protein [Deltaproteobacteria bacterium]
MKRIPAWIRENAWGLAGALVSCILFLWLFLRDSRAHVPYSDGHYIWLYARSLVFDRDIYFANDYAFCGDPQNNAIYDTRHPHNPYYLGPGLLLVPILAVVKLIVPLGAQAPAAWKNGCSGPWVTTTLGICCVIGALTFFLCYRIARRWANDGTATLACALQMWAGTFAAYSSVLPVYSHLFQALAIALLVLTSIQASEKPERIARWIAPGAMVGLAFLQRPPEVVFGIIPAVLAFIALRRKPKLLVLSAVAMAVPAAILAIPQLATWKYLYGSYFANPTGGYTVSLSSAHPFLLLFGGHGGYFFTTPIVWLGVLALPFALRLPSSRWIVAAGLVAAAAILWVYSSSLDWDGSGAFGARRLTNFVPLNILLTAILLDRLREAFLNHPRRALVALGVSVLVPFTFVNIGGFIALPAGKLPWSGSVPQASQYGIASETMWGVIDEGLGDLAILPAEVVFAARYRLPMNRFRDATDGSWWYARDHMRLTFNAQDLPFVDWHLAKSTRGTVMVPEGVQLVRNRATLVFSAQWRVATSFKVLARAKKPATLRISRRDFWGRTWYYGELAIPGGLVAFEGQVPVPPKGFGSGVNELVFDVNDVSAEVVLRALKPLDERVLIPSMAHRTTPWPLK